MQNEESFGETKNSSFQGWTVGIKQQEWIKKMLKKEQEKQQKNTRKLKMSLNQQSSQKKKLSESRYDKIQTQLMHQSRKYDTLHDIDIPLSNVKVQQKKETKPKRNYLQEVKMYKLSNKHLRKEERQLILNRQSLEEFSNLSRLKQQAEQLEREDTIFGRTRYNQQQSGLKNLQKTQTNLRQIVEEPKATIISILEQDPLSQLNNQAIKTEQPEEKDKTHLHLDFMRLKNEYLHQLSNSLSKQSYIVNNTFKNTVNRKISLKQKQRNYIKKIHTNSRHRSFVTLLPKNHIDQKWSMSKKEGEEIENGESNQENENGKESDRKELMNKLSVVYPIDLGKKQHHRYENIRELANKQSLLSMAKNMKIKQPQGYCEDPDSEAEQYLTLQDNKIKKSENLDKQFNNSIAGKYKKSVLKRQSNRFSNSEFSDEKNVHKKKLNQSQPSFALFIDNKSRKILGRNLEVSKMEISAKTKKNAKSCHKILNKSERRYNESIDEDELGKYFQSSINLKEEDKSYLGSKDNDRKGKSFSKTGQQTKKQAKERNNIISKKILEKLEIIRKKIMHKDGNFEVVVV